MYFHFFHVLPLFFLKSAPVSVFWTGKFSCTSLNVTWIKCLYRWFVHEYVRKLWLIEISSSSSCSRFRSRFKNIESATCMLKSPKVSGRRKVEAWRLTQRAVIANRSKWLFVSAYRRAEGFNLLPLPFIHSGKFPIPESIGMRCVNNALVNYEHVVYIVKCETNMVAIETWVEHKPCSF